MNRKKLLQKLAQLIDKYPFRKEIVKDYLDLKFNEQDRYFLTLKNKYKDEI